MSDCNPVPVSAQRSYRPSHEVTNRIAGPVIMMMQFRKWSEAVNGTVYLSHSYESVLDKAKKTFSYTSIKIYVDTYDDKTSINNLRRCLEVVDDTAIIWPSQASHPYVSAEKFLRDVIMKQEPGTTFVLATDENPTAQKTPIWQQVIEKHHGTPCQIIRYTPGGVFLRSILNGFTSDVPIQRSEPILDPQPLSNVYSSGELSLLSERPILDTDALVDRQQVQTQSLIVEELGLQANVVVPTADEIPSQQSVAQNVPTERAAAQASRVFPKDEDKVETSNVVVTEKAIGKKGDDFLHFLERALALYEKA